jgi:hypothetical protein
MELTEKYYKQIMNKTKLVNYLLEISYEGNVGLHEMVKFFQVATPDDVKKFEQLMSVNDLPNAWELIQQVVGVRLKGL